MRKKNYKILGLGLLTIILTSLLAACGDDISPTANSAPTASNTIQAATTQAATTLAPSLNPPAPASPTTAAPQTTIAAKSTTAAPQTTAAAKPTTAMPPKTTVNPNPTTIASKPTSLLNPCNLYSKGEIQAMLPDFQYNEPTRDELTSPTGYFVQSRCTYVFGLTKSGTDFVQVALFRLRVGQSDSLNRELWQQLQNTPGMQPVSGLGDDAFLMDNERLFVLKGQTIFSLEIYAAGPVSPAFLKTQSQKLVARL